MLKVATGQKPIKEIENLADGRTPEVTIMQTGCPFYYGYSASAKQVHAAEQ